MPTLIVERRTMHQPGKPKPTLSVLDAAAVLVGMVIGAGIFTFPPMVAGNVNGPGTFLLVWLIGGVISLIGALCYAELATTYPDAGGEYHFLGRAFGAPPAFLFAWARMTVIQTGSIAIQAFVIGEYASRLKSFGEHSAAIYAAVVVVGLTALNIAGLKLGKTAQILLTSCEVLALLTLAIAGLVLAPQQAPAGPAPIGTLSATSLGMAMVFVLLTFGGWNEAAYLSAELRGGRRRIVHVLVLGITLVTAIYLIVNLALLRGLGFAGVAGSRAVGADLMNTVAGERGAQLLSLLIVVAAFSTVNATILTGARTNYALGRDFPLLARLGRWNDRADAPRNALILQGAISLALVAFGAATRRGVETMVDYTAPIFWAFFLLTTASLFVLRAKDPNVERPFRVPLYPFTPIVFCAVCLYMLYSSVMYAGVYAIVGVGVLVLGTPLMLIARRRADSQKPEREFEPVILTPPRPAAEP